MTCASNRDNYQTLVKPTHSCIQVIKPCLSYNGIQTLHKEVPQRATGKENLKSYKIPNRHDFMFF